MRITRTTVLRRLSTDILKNEEKVAQTSRQLSTGRRVSMPSDDPVDVVRLMQLKEDVNRFSRFESNAKDANDLLNIVEQTLNSITTVMQRVKAIAVQGASDTLTPQERADLACELDELIDELINSGNTKYQGTYLLGGTENTEPPFVAVKASDQTTDVIYCGNDRENSYNIGADSQISVGVDPVPSLNAMKAAITLRDHLLADDALAISSDITTVNQAIDGVLLGKAEIGARQNALDVSRNRSLDIRMSSEESLSEVRDIDVTEAAIRFSSYQVNHQASLKVFSSIMSQPTLVDYLT